MSAVRLRERRSRSFVVGNETIAVRVRESRRARAARITVWPGRPLEIVVPRGVADEEVDRLLEEKRRWIEGKVVAPRPQLGLDRAGVVWVEGRALPLERRNGSRSVAELAGTRLLVGGPEGGTTEAVERWYRRTAREKVIEVADREAAGLGLEYRSVAIRDQKTRWGSCSSRGTLSFSWRLLVAPREVLEYVVVHELCHLHEPNHSKAFWRLLDAAWPSWREQSSWLREHGQELQEYRPGTG